MSIEAMAIALNHSRATGTAKLILVGIASHDGDGGAWPSVATLARYGNCTVRNAQRALAKLAELGEIRIYQQQGGNQLTPDHTRPNLYEFLLRCSPECDRSKRHRSRYELDPLTPASPADASVTPPPDASVTPPPDASVTRTVLRNTPGTNQASAVSARATVQPAPKLPKLADIPNPTKPKTRERSDAERAEVAELEALTCPAFPSHKHWFPADLTECARGCGHTLTTTAEEAAA